MSTHDPPPTNRPGSALARAIRGSAFLVAARMLARAGNFVFFLVLARLFTTETVGDYAYYQAIALIIFGIVEYGLGTLVTRDVSGDEEVRWSSLRPALSIRAILVITFTLLLFFPLSAWLDRIRMGLFFGAMVADSLTSLIVTGARRDGRLARLAAAEMFRWWSMPALLLILSGALRLSRFADRAPLAPFFAVALSALTCVVVVAIAERRYLVEQFQAPAPAKNPYWRSGMLLAAATAAVGVNNRVDLIMLRWLESQEVVGIYAACYVFINAALLIPMRFSYVLFPDLSRIRSEGSEELRHVVLNGARALALAGSGVATVLAALASPLLTLAYPDTYVRGSTTLQVLCLALPFIFVSNLYWNVLVSRNRQGRILLYISSSALLNAALNLVLVPRFSLVGAGWATVTSEIVVLLLAGLTLARCGLPRLPVRLLAAIIAVTAAPALAIHWLGPRLDSFWVFCTAMAVWALLALGSGLLRMQDVRTALGRPA